jgi:hypothetical protein
MKELEEIVVEIEEALAGHRRSTRKTATISRSNANMKYKLVLFAKNA